MIELRAILVAAVIAMPIGASGGIRAQPSGRAPVQTMSPPRLLVGYVRDSGSTANASNGGVLLRYRDRQQRVISVSIRPMMGSGGQWSRTEEVDSIARVQDEMLRTSNAEGRSGACRIAYADMDSIPVVNGTIRGRAVANVCSVGDSAVDNLLYAYPVRDKIIVFQSTMTQSQWNTSRFELFIHEYVQFLYAGVVDSGTRR
jgi:hypothetical protein